MPGPTAYIPTTKNISQYYKGFLSAGIDKDGKIVKFGPQNVINHGIEMGCTYTFPLMNFPTKWFYAAGDKPEFYRGLSGSKNLMNVIDYWQRVGPNKRASQPSMYNAAREYEWIEDQIGSTYGTGVGQYLTRNWGSTTASGYVYNPWGLCGAEEIEKTWDRCFEALNAKGQTLDYCFIDMEGTMFDGYNIGAYQGDARIPYVIVRDSRYSQEWEGLCAWKYYYEEAGGSTLFNLNEQSLFNQYGGGIYGIPWDNASSKYVARMKTLAHYYPLQKYFPDVKVSNYGLYISDGFTAPSGKYFPNRGGNAGNVPSTINYTTVPGGGYEGTNALRVSKDNTSAPLIFYANPPIGKHVGLLWSYRAAFMIALQLCREVKRNSPTLEHHPWVAGVNCWTEGYPGTIWPTVSSSQSDANVLANSWDKTTQIQSITSGITAPDGSTTAYQILSITSRNTPTAEQLKDFPSPFTGRVHFSGIYWRYSGSQWNPLQPYVEYFLYGTTAGATYTFSYHVDLSRGNTATKFRVGLWKPYYSWETSGQGLTFNQILPIGTGPFFRENAIGFSSGDSGWTKVSFQFQGLTNPTLSMSIFSADNNVVGSTVYGTTSYIWNPTLEADLGGGITVNIPLTALNARRYEVSSICPNIAYADATKGYNPKLDAYFTRRSGNSAYYYEMLRHFALINTRSFAFFNGNLYMDYTLPGATATPGDNWSTFYNKASAIYFSQGGTSAKQLYQDFNNCLGELNTLLGGYTSTTAFTGWADWAGSYVIDGAPIKGGTSWLWRVTSLPGYTTYCNGETLSTYGKVGTWVTTSENTLAGICLYSQKWALPQEPGVTAPTVDFNFMTMTTLNEIVSAGLTFTRGSTATYINSQGKLAVVTGDTPRFAYDPDTLENKGLLLEPSGINLLNWSESFATTGGAQNNWIDFNLSRTAGNTSPSNSLNAIRFTATGSNATLLSSNGIGETRERCLSFWMKGFTGNESVFYTFNNGITWNAVNNLGTNWKRFEFGPNTGDQTVGFKIGNTSDSIYIWGVQLERSKSESLDASLVPGITYYAANLDSISSSYIPTQGNTGQRKNEFLAGISFSWLGLTYGTFIYEVENIHQGGLNVTSNNSSWYGMCFFAPTGPRFSMTFYDLGAAPNYQLQIDSAFWSLFQWNERALGSRSKVAINYKPGRFGIVSNGVAQSIQENSNFPGFVPIYNNGLPINYMAIGIGIQNTSWTSGYTPIPKNPMYVRRLRYWNKYFSESLLKAMTVADMEIFAVDNSVEYTWERYNSIVEPYTFNLENSEYLT